MNHEIEYFNHKTRLAELRQESKGFGLLESIKQPQEEVLSGASIMQKLLGWMSRFNSKSTAKSKRTAAYHPSSQ